MVSRMGLAVQAFKEFIKVTHCDGRDRCTAGVFNDTLLWERVLASDKADIFNCLNHVDVRGGTRLYDSLCGSVDHLLEHGDRSRPWVIVVITHDSDNMSTRSASECRMHIQGEYNMLENSSIFVLSVGSNTRDAGLDAMEEQGCLNHVPVSSFLRLGSALMSISFGKISSIQSAIDYVVVISSSASMGVLDALPKAPPLAKSRLGMPSPKVAPVVPAHVLASGGKQSKPMLCIGSAPSGNTNSVSVKVKIRELSNSSLHPDDRQIFREFALENYPGINTSWNEDEIEFLVLVESVVRCIVGLLAMLPYDGDKVHIRLMVVDREYRKRGLGAMMLTHVAARYPDKKVTLNVAFDRLDLLEFYYDKGYASLDSVSTKNKVLILSLDHLGIFSRMPLPE